MTRIAPVLVLLALLAAAPPAGAKGVSDPRVCGADGCVPVPLDGHTLMALEGAEPTAAPSAPGQPHLALRFGRFTGPDTVQPVTNRFLPRAGLILAEDRTWRRPSPEALATLRRLGKGLERFGAVAPRAAAGAPEAQGGPSSLLLGGLGVLALAGAAAGLTRHRRAAARG